MGQHGKIAVVYHYFEKTPGYRDNLIYFLARGWQPDLEFFIVIAGEHSVDLPQRDNIRYIHTGNFGHDFGSYAGLAASGALDTYDRLIFVNCTVRGPFLPHYADQSWTVPFLNQLTGDVHLCGATINILHDNRPAHAAYRDRHPNDPTPYSHVQSSAHAMTGDCFDLLKAQNLYANAPGLDKNGAVSDCELRMSALVRGNGWNISCWLPPYGALDYRQPHSDINPATQNGHPQTRGAYFGLTPHPFELVFLKTGWNLLPLKELEFHSLMGLQYHPRGSLDWSGGRDLRARLARRIGGPLGEMSDRDQARNEIAKTEPTLTVRAAKPTNPQQSCLMVLGMHRSGTSALAGALTLLGATPPGTQMEPHFSNPKGFFESIPVRDLNDALLASAGSSWKDWRPIDPDWFTTPEVRAKHDAAIRVLDGEFGTTGLFVLKDPRICRLLPFWHAVLEKRGTRLLPLLTHRNPQEVAGSLASRYRFEPAFTHLLWLRHTLEAEAACRGLPRHFTSYDRLLETAPAVVAGIAKTFGLPLYTDTAAQDMEGFLSAGLRNHRTTAGSGAGLLARWYRDSYAIFERLAAGVDDAADLTRLDAIRAEFDDAVPVFAPILTNGRRPDPKPR
ncbi:sulfotransferase family protein [Puniceibacterium sp. IMCC21224]|uniref:sulfotransferase family protein n=1 Tax=Puniceibacterium sp. IMCC21224 TaxID=1618204 RepID=UPI00065CC9C0|nr:sulfotransferase family protein [Puniceibacterium sp. IMCC21224]KMK64017.1 Sulfotransferase family [Puniceibacterium sp. IMCC21224]